MGSLTTPNNNANPTTGQAANTDFSSTLANALAAIQSNTSSGTAAQQQNLAASLNNQANGGGPNLGQTQLTQGLQQAQAATASNAASQRGASPGLAARNASYQQAGQTQQMAGQAALERQQQQLAAQQQEGQVLGQTAAGQIGQQQANTQGAGVVGQLQNAQNQGIIQATGNTQGLNQQANEFNANLNQQMLGAGIGAVGSIAGSGTTLLSAHGGSIPSHKELASALRSRHVQHLDGGGFSAGITTGGEDFAGAGKASGGSGGLMSMLGGSGGSGGSGGGAGALSELAALAHGGMPDHALGAALRRHIQHLDGGGFVSGMASAGQAFAGAGKAKQSWSIPSAGDSSDDDSNNGAAGASSNPTSNAGDIPVSDAVTGPADAPSGAVNSAGPEMVAARGGEVDVLEEMARGGLGSGQRFRSLAHALSRRPGVNDPDALAAAIGRKKYGVKKFGALSHKADGGSIDFRAGGHVPGEAKVRGDSYANDTVPALLSPREIVIPRHITTRPNAPQRAAEFVAAIQRSAARKGTR